MNAERTRLTEELDIAFSKWVIARDGYKCTMCGSENMLDCNHIIGRGNKTLRWDPKNAITLCRNCHMTWHRDETKGRKYVEEHYPLVWEYLCEVRFDTIDLSVTALREKLLELSDPPRYGNW